MALSPLAGKPAPKEMLVDLNRLEQAYVAGRPDLADPAQRVSFGTSGHRGSSLHGSFTEAHILAIAQAICDYRQAHGVAGPLFMGKDTHALSAPAQRTALEVLAANDVVTVIQRDDGFTPTPVISHAILTYNRGWTDRLADGIVITPSHNPPEDGGFKYMVTASELAGETITQKLTRAPGNNAAIGGLKVVTANGWFAARPSGTEAVSKIYAESFRGKAHLDALVNEARQILQDVR
jgi:phosphoglucomutase